MPTALAISPHLDDAVFSAGGTLARLTGDGWRVLIATVFTASVADPQGFALACQLDKGIAADVDYMALRRQEDRRACAVIDAEVIWLPFREAPHRGYGSAQSLFSGLIPGDGIVGEIAPSLMRLCERVAPDLVLAPRAVGAHVDHVAVVLALDMCATACWLWTDFPYNIRPAVRPSPFAAASGAAERIVTLGPDVLRAKVAAGLSYESQLGFQFGGIDEARAALAGDAREGFLVMPGADCILNITGPP